jgi:hypothetical protein
VDARLWNTGINVKDVQAEVDYSSNSVAVCAFTSG